MVIIRFREAPRLISEAIGQKRLAGLKKHQDNFNFLRSCLDLLSPELKRLFF